MSLSYVTLYDGVGPAEKWFYLVFQTDGATGLPSERVPRLGNHEINSFVASGVHASDYAFVLVDIGIDKRLENDIGKLAGGPELVARIKEHAAAFLITPSPIPQIKDVKEIECYPVHDYEKDSDIIYDKMGLHRPARRRAFIRLLKRTNQYLHLKPNILGLGFNINEMISHWLEIAEKRM